MAQYVCMPRLSQDMTQGRIVEWLKREDEAVKEGDDGSTVTVINSGKQITRKVETGLIGADNTEIVSGLSESDTVVTAIIDPTNPASTAAGQAGAGRMGGFGGLGGPGGGGRMRGMR